MKVSAASLRYAKAWLGSVDSSKHAVLLEDVESVLSTLKESRELGLFIGSPIHENKVKMSVLKEIFESHVSADMMGLIELLVQKNRTGLLQDVCLAVKKQIRDDQGILDVFIDSSTPLSDEVLRSMISSLEKVTSKNVDPTLKVDESLIGGVRIQMGDQVIDGTLKAQLETLRSQLSHTV
ncbi:MAG TPA: ATP synthase F1 subunit delta [Bacteroidetes bacterium]|nr:ATP synthase F1 subunit delta [Bacteroidota bacterium]MDA0906674.1 ATP synthase F1 subunit delta [Bacteroidota bacterium]HBD42750.1 ATP synthase F1 subunit delta [Bacteroidota bacterium]|tara:strand:+ start:925 stop:1464 length:540 start_codon:yes stop_codon:yes gene_type:complete